DAPAARPGRRARAVPRSPRPSKSRASDRRRAPEPLEQEGGRGPGTVSREAPRAAPEPGEPGRDRPAARGTPDASTYEAGLRRLGPRVPPRVSPRRRLLADRAPRPAPRDPDSPPRGRR